MAIFENKFLSAAGQKERLANVGATLKASLSGKGVTANTKNETVNKVLSGAASNPFTTAAIVAGVANPTGLASAIKSSYSTLGAKGKLVVAAAVPAVAAIVVSNPKGTIKTVAEAPKDIANFTTNILNFAKDKNVDNLKTIGSENPVLTGVVVGAAGAAGYYGLKTLNEIKDISTPENKEPNPNKNNSNPFMGNPPVSNYTDGNIVNTKDSNSSTGAPSPPLSNANPSGAPVNIQQNNYFGDKISERYINSKKNIS